MGQTLENSIYLPDEGETNCYSGLASNWRALDTLKGNYSLHAINVDIHVTAAEKETWNSKADASALTAHTGNTTIHVTAEDKQAWNGKADASALTAHTGDTTIHVTAEDKQAWNGKADASALTAHTGDTTIHVTAEDKEAWNGKADNSALTAHTGDATIHVTAEDKTKWDAVTRKADDSGVVHKSGAESIAGLKTFTDLLSIDGDYLGTEASTNQRTNLQLRSNRDTEGKSGALITRFRQNRSQGGMSTGDLQMVGIDFLENEIRTSDVLSVQATGWADNVPTKVNIISAVGWYSYGTSERPCKINGLNPGALSLPNLSAGVDISGYFTVGTTENTYTPTVDGWISIRGTASGTAGIYVENSKGFYASANSMIAYTGTDRYVNLCFPVISGETYNIVLKGVSTSVDAKFFPCMGNV